MRSCLCDPLFLGKWNFVYKYNFPSFVFMLFLILDGTVIHGVGGQDWDFTLLQIQLKLATLNGKRK